MPEQPKLYNFEQAKDEAAKMQEKIKSGEATEYDEAEKITEKKGLKTEKGDQKKEDIKLNIANFIDVPGLKITKENGKTYFVRYGKEKREIIKDDKTYFEMPSSSSSGQGLRLAQTHRQELHFKGGIFQDKETPKKFQEVMMFHELREWEYREHDIENAHERAVNDEILYILKYFSLEDQKAYLEFAKEYREKAQKDQQLKLLKEKREKKRYQREEEKKKKEEEIKKKSEEERLAKEKERQNRVEVLKKIVEPELGLPKNLSPEEIKEISGIDTWLGIEYLSRPTFLHCLGGSAGRKGVTSGWIESMQFDVEKRASMFKATPNILNNNIYQLLKNRFCNDFNLFLNRIKIDHSLEFKNNQEITVDREIAERWEAKFLVLKDFFDQAGKLKKQDFKK